MTPSSSSWVTRNTRLTLSVRTVDSHIYRAMSKAGTTSRTNSPR
jgi:hypothetical protein